MRLLRLVAIFVALWATVAGAFWQSRDSNYDISGGAVATTWDPAKKGTDISLSGGNLIANDTANTSTWSTVLSTSSKTSGKFCVEFVQGTYNVGTNADNLLYGFAQNNQNLNSPLTGAGDAGFTRASNGGSGPGVSGVVSVNSANLPTYTMANAGGDVLQLCLDFTANKGWVGYNNTFGGSPAAGTNPAFTWTGSGAAWFIGWSRFSESANGSAVTIRFSSASFSFTPPTGFVSWD